ncbi:MAG: hypothetical protein V3574_00380 [Candidatus Moraniibacteriota bacterium]
MANQKIIILSTVFFILISFSFLAFWEKKQSVITNGWFLYFDDIQTSSANFTVENYTDKEDFEWKLYLNDKFIKKESFQVLKNNSKSVIIDKQPELKSIKIKVFHSKEVKEIYKNFE